MPDLIEGADRIRKRAVDNVYRYHYSKVLFQLRLWRTGVITEDQFKSSLDKMERQEYEHVIRGDANAFINRYRKAGVL